jgi:tRNA pseudouridine55 synthase
LILKVAKGMIGHQEQVPPMFSAKKINGKRAYELAREGKEVELKKNTIEISEFEITQIEVPRVFFRIVCSKGTYIRSIARDFGLALDSGGYLSELRRTRIGSYHVDDSLNVEKAIELIEASAS